MFRLVSRILLIAAAAAWLGGCSSNGGMNSLFTDNGKPAAQAAPSAQAAEGSEAMAMADPAAEPQAGFGQNLRQDDVTLGKKYYRARDYGLAEQHFRAAAESHPRNAEAWLGLAASYDQLRRFDLADRAYTQATKLAGETVEIINNQGYSYILRGDYRRARERLMLANVKAPDNPYVQANLKLLAERSGRPMARQ